MKYFKCIRLTYTHFNISLITDELILIEIEYYDLYNGRYTVPNLANYRRLQYVRFNVTFE